MNVNVFIHSTVQILNAVQRLSARYVSLIMTMLMAHTGSPVAPRQQKMVDRIISHRIILIIRTTLYMSNGCRYDEKNKT